MTKSQKAGFLHPISSKITAGNEKERHLERRKRKSEEDERRRREKKQWLDSSVLQWLLWRMFDRRGLFGGSGKNPAGEIYTMPYIFVLKLLHTKYCKK